MASIPGKEKPRHLDINPNGIIFLETRAIGNARTRVARQKFHRLRESEIPLLYLWVESNAIAKSIDTRFKVTAQFVKETVASAAFSPWVLIHAYFDLPPKGKKRWAVMSQPEMLDESQAIAKQLNAHGLYAVALMSGETDTELEMIIGADSVEEAGKGIQLAKDLITVTPLREVWKP